MYYRFFVEARFPAWNWLRKFQISSQEFSQVFWLDWLGITMLLRLPTILLPLQLGEFLEIVKDEWWSFINASRALLCWNSHLKFRQLNTNWAKTKDTSTMALPLTVQSEKGLIYRKPTTLEIPDRAKKLEQLD